MIEHNKPSLVIHRQRLTEEVIFQYLVKNEVFNAIPLGELRKASRRINSSVGNAVFKASNPEILIDDKTANDERWIFNLLLKEYANQKGEK